MIVENDIEVENKEKVIENYNKTYNNKVLSDFINTFGMIKNDTNFSKYKNRR